MDNRQSLETLAVRLIAVSVRARRHIIRQRIEALAVTVAEYSAMESFEIITDALMQLKGLIQFGKTIYEIEPITANTMIEEIELHHINLTNKYSFKQEQENRQKPANMDGFTLPDEVQKSAIVENKPAKKIAVEIKNGNGISEIGNPFDNSAIRQSAIVEKIRQNSKQQIQMKDIVREFKEVSERTLRYDIQKLCSTGILERTGGSVGAGISYRVRKI